MNELTTELGGDCTPKESLEKALQEMPKKTGENDKADMGRSSKNNNLAKTENEE